MKTLEDLLLLGNPKLYEKSDIILKEELLFLETWVADLDNVMNEIRAKYNFGRAIAAPQLGIMKRLIYMNINSPKVFINPEIISKSKEMIELWDDCMSFPNLLVKLKRHKSIRVKYFNQNWEIVEDKFEDDLSELFQHEYDHLEGVLATQRALSPISFKWRK